MFAQDFLRRSGNKSAPEAVTFHNPAKHGFEALSTNIILICRKMVFMLGVQLGFSNYIQTNSKHKLTTPLNNNQTMRQERWNGMEQSLKTAAPPTKEGETGKRSLVGNQFLSVGTWEPNNHTKKSPVLEIE